MKRKAKSKAKSLVALQMEKHPASPSPQHVVTHIAAGLDFDELETLRQQLELPMDQLATNLGLSRATLHRRKNSGRLTSEESDKVVRFARILGHAVHLFGGADEARQWLKAPQRGLGGAVPLEYARTEAGAREVENLLGRIDYGVYS